MPTTATLKKDVSANATQAHRILVIDDNESIHQDFRKILMQTTDSSSLDAAEAMLFGDAAPVSQCRNYEMDTAAQGQQGRDMVLASLHEKRPYALVFVDMRMPPGWDGVETIEQLWKVDPNLQVVICSAFSDYTWSQITDRLGQNDRLLILKKPFDNVEVSQLALALTEKWAAGRKIAQQMEQLETAVVERTQSLNNAVGLLSESQQFLNATIDSLSSRIAILDEQGHVVATNANWRNANDNNPFARSSIGEGDNYSEACLSATAEDLATQLTDAIQQMFSSQLDKFSLKYSYECALGTERWFHVVVTYFHMDNVIRVVVAHDDITELKNLQGQLAHAQKLEAVGQLAAGVAHEINTPIQYVGDNIRFLHDSFGDLLELVTAASEFLDEATNGTITESAIARMRAKLEAADVDYLAEEIPTAISQSTDGVDRVAKIVRAMKEFSHPGQEGKSKVDLNHAIESTITVAASEWKYVADIKTEFDPDLPPVPCLPGELNQVFLNLLVNAAHAIADVVGDGENGKGTITITTSHNEEYVQIRVSDTGTGIPVHARERIFDPFFTTKEVGKGTGQGLAMAHSIIVDRHDGKISFKTTENQGTTFEIELPLLEAKQN